MNSLVSYLSPTHLQSYKTNDGRRQGGEGHSNKKSRGENADSSESLPSMLRPWVQGPTEKRKGERKRQKKGGRDREREGKRKRERKRDRRKKKDCYGIGE